MPSIELSVKVGILQLPAFRQHCPIQDWKTRYFQEQTVNIKQEDSFYPLHQSLQKKYDPCIKLQKHVLAQPNLHRAFFI